MSVTKRLARVLASKAGNDIEIAIETQDGQQLKVTASKDQIDMLVDELEDVLNSPDEPAEGPPAAA